MNGEKKNGINWLSIIGFLWGVLCPICLGLGIFFIAFYDSPIDRQAGMGFLDYTLIWSVLSFPVLCLISSLGIWLLNKRNKRAATFVAILPIIPLIPIFAIFGGLGSPKTDKPGDDVQVSECISPLSYEADGLDTTGCGSLQSGIHGSGTLSTTSEAHNWQFSTESGLIKITVENDGNSCPHVIVLDSNAAPVEGFEDENNLRLCPSGMITTGFFEFNPPSPGSYTVRVFAPEKPGTYWLKIEP